MSQNRQAATAASISGSESFLDRNFAELGIPLFDIVAGRKGLKRIGYQFSADGPALLGPLWGPRAAAAGGES